MWKVTSRCISNSFRPKESRNLLLLGFITHLLLLLVFVVITAIPIVTSIYFFLASTSCCSRSIFPLFLVCTFYAPDSVGTCKVVSQCEQQAPCES
jgi:hypothetical protein